MERYFHGMCPTAGSDVDFLEESPFACLFPRKQRRETKIRIARTTSVFDLFQKAQKNILITFLNILRQPRGPSPSFPFGDKS
jgi:hypothetical protein